MLATGAHSDLAAFVYGTQKAEYRCLFSRAPSFLAILSTAYAVFVNIVMRLLQLSRPAYVQVAKKYDIYGLRRRWEIAQGKTPVHLN